MKHVIDPITPPQHRFASLIVNESSEAAAQAFGVRLSRRRDKPEIPERSAWLDAVQPDEEGGDLPCN